MSTYRKLSHIQEANKRLENRVLSEQSVSPNPPTTSVRPTNTTSARADIKSVRNNAQSTKPPYCKVGESQGVIRQVPTSKSGPNVNMGETGFGLYDNSNKLICIISTKYTQGGTVSTPTN